MKNVQRDKHEQGENERSIFREDKNRFRADEGRVCSERMRRGRILGKGRPGRKEGGENKGGTGQEKRERKFRG